MVAGRNCHGTLGSFPQIVIKEMHINPFSSPLPRATVSPASGRFSSNHNSKKLRAPGVEREGWVCRERRGLVSLRWRRHLVVWGGN